MLKWPEDFKDKIVCGNCLELFPQIPDNSIDIAVTSPPYNMGGKNLGGQPNSTIGQKLYDMYGDDLSPEDYKNLIFKTVEFCIAKCRYTFWNMQMVTSSKDTIIELIWTFRNNLKDIFIWNKQAVAQIGVLDNPRFATGYEFILIFGKDNNRIFRDVNFPANGYVPNIQTWFKSENFKEHHATFPKEMPAYFIRYFTKEGGIVLDPFSGTGTTAMAAKENGRHYIGFELSPLYCKVSNERLAQEVLF